MTVKRLFALASVVAAVAFPSFAQTRELNPTVKVLARPQSPVPAECATDPATVPALEAEAPAQEAVTAAVPPSNDLRASLRRLQVAAEGDDYAVFKSALAEARRAVASHPPGGERNAANDALQVFADIGRVWDYAMTSPTGSFFDASVQSGSLLNALKRYPEYGRTIADQTVTVGGKTLYPTPETRRFLSHESARRLTRLGVSTPAHVARGSQPEPLPRRIVAAPPAVVKKPVQIAARPPAPKPITKVTAPKKTASTTSAPKKTEPKPAVKAANATPPKTKEVAIKAAPLPKSKPPAPPPVKVAETSTMPPGPPIVATPQATPPTTTTAAPATQTTATTTSAPPPATTSTTDTTVTSAPTDTSVTAAPDTAATGTAVPPAKQNGNMNLILAVVLILVGIGVLVVLFRASD
jgi:hypothetical protein